MDVLRLDSSTYLPNALVEGYTSMIWTERYDKEGEFEMKTPKVTETRALLPEGALISLLDSSEVMFVETHSIGVDDDGVPELTLKGETYPIYLKNRILQSTVYKEPWQVYRQYNTAELASMLMWNALVNSSGKDVSRQNRIIETTTVVPQVVITDSTSLVEAVKIWWLEEGNVHKALVDILILAKLGLRTIRPKNTTGNVMSFDTSTTTSHGTVTKTSTQNISSLRLDIYNGLDRSRGQSDREPVMFHYDSGHIDNPQYLFSSKELKVMAKVSSGIGNIDVWPGGTTPPNPEPTGLSRRILYFDAGDIGTEATYNTFRQAVIQKGQIELAKHNRAIIFDGAISPIAPYKYNTQYFLGDKVTLLAQYGFESTMVVAEYVRTEDQSGDRGYPTLVLSS